MKGRRLPDNAPLGDFQPGDYSKMTAPELIHKEPPHFWLKTPNGHWGRLLKHEVTEHEDGTITVSPSILVSNNTGKLWHGFLERGVWRAC